MGTRTIVFKHRLELEREFQAVLISTFRCVRRAQMAAEVGGLGVDASQFAASQRFALRGDELVLTITRANPLVVFDSGVLLVRVLFG